MTPRRNWQERPRASEFLASGGAHLFFIDARPELHARPGDLGGEIFADFQGRLTHVGAMAFSGSLIDAVKT